MKHSTVYSFACIFELFVGSRETVMTGLSWDYQYSVGRNIHIFETTNQIIIGYIPAMSLFFMVKLVKLVKSLF